MHVDVIILTYGEPQKNSFWEHWIYSNRILEKLTRRVVPIPRFAVPFFGAYRAMMRTRLWRKHGYGSPLELITEDQRAGIEKYLKELEPSVKWRVRVVYDFRDPPLVPLLDHLTRWQCERLVFMPMYLPVSDFTHEISWRDYMLFQSNTTIPLPLARLVILRPYLHELAEILAQYITTQVNRRLVHQKSGDFALVLGCHGTLVHPPEGIKDTGYRDTFKTYQLLETLLRPQFKAMGIGWLNHRLGGEWTRPTLEETVKTMQGRGIRQFIYYPFGFLADNAETQLEGRTVFTACGVKETHHLPCINENPEFLQFLAKLIIHKSLLADRAVSKDAAA